MYYYIDKESGVGATTTLVVAAIVMALFGNVNLFKVIGHHPILTFLILGGYAVVGTMWAFAKFTIYVRDRRERFEEAKTDYLKHHTLPPTDPKDVTDGMLPYELRTSISKAYTAEEKLAAQEAGLKALVTEYNRGFMNTLLGDQLAETGPDGKVTEKPYVRNHKSQIMFWLGWWPFSLTWAICNDFFHHLFKTIYQHISGRLQQIADRVFSSTTSELATVPVPTKTEPVSNTGSPTT